MATQEPPPEEPTSEGTPPTPFSVSLPPMAPGEARALLQTLADERDALLANDGEGLRRLFDERGIRVGSGLLAERPLLPPEAELRRALAAFSEIETSSEEGKGEFRFNLDPFGPYTPGKGPFIVCVTIAASANAG
jgi:hypothetical protein